jgi:hypothetical protein
MVSISGLFGGVFVDTICCETEMLFGKSAMFLDLLFILTRDAVVLYQPERWPALQTLHISHIHRPRLDDCACQFARRKPECQADRSQDNREARRARPRLIDDEVPRELPVRFGRLDLVQILHERGHKVVEDRGRHFPCQRPALFVDLVDPEAARRGVDVPSEQAPHSRLYFRLQVRPVGAIERDRRLDRLGLGPAAGLGARPRHRQGPSSG